MGWFWQHGVLVENLTPLGRWLIVALRWTRDGYARNHTLRDLIHLTALAPVGEQILSHQQALEGFGLWSNVDLAQKTADFFISPDCLALSMNQEKILHLTRPTIERPIAPFSKKLLWLTRPPGAGAALLARALWPTAQQLAFSLHQPAPVGLGRLVAVLRWYLRGLMGKG